MTIDISGETEQLISSAVENGVSPNAADLVEAAVRRYLGTLENRTKGRYQVLRQRIEASGLSLLDEEGIRQEVAERRGSCS
jgi:Arc/MetJ-type ribon-helix-helix transcriptional regulator